MRDCPPSLATTVLATNAPAGMLIALERHILAAVIVEDMPPLLCRAAGEALGAVRGSSLADAVVMASAALRGGGVVYTADVDDLRRLRRHFPTVLVLPV